MLELCLHAQMQAWLGLTPKDQGRTNGEVYATLRAPDVPDDYAHIPQFLQDIGVASKGFDGLVSLTFTEIDSWGRRMNIDLTPFESQAMRNMSVSFVSVAGNPDSECPIDTGEIHEEQSEVHVGGWMQAAQ